MGSSARADSAACEITDRSSYSFFTGAGDPIFFVIGVSTPVAGAAVARGVSPAARSVVVSTAAAGTAIVSGPFVPELLQAAIAENTPSTASPRVFVIEPPSSDVGGESGQ